MQSLDALPAWKLVGLFASKQLSPVEYVSYCLGRIDADDPMIRAFITVAADSALADARRVEAAIASAEPLTPLAGIPVAVKDEVWTKGIRSTAGSLLFQDFVPDADGAVIQRLREAGAVMIGKTNMPEFASFPLSHNDIASACVNPRDHSRISGASSGGSAAALAAGMAPLAIGSDGGGSIRIPSALCGVIGLFPTPGLVPARGSFSYSPYASLGPMGRDVRDVALLLQALAGHDPLDPTSLSAERVDYLTGLDDGVRGLRIAWTPDYGHVEFADPRVRDLPRQAALALEQAGAIVSEPGFTIEDTFETMAVITGGAGKYSDRPAPYVQTGDVTGRIAQHPELLSPHLRDRAEIAPERYQRAAESRDRLRARLDGLFSRYDVILSPTMAEVAPAVPDGWLDPYARHDMGTTFTSLVNITENCAASVPCGQVDGLPVGVQVIGPRLHEARVLKVCRVLEQVLA